MTEVDAVHTAFWKGADGLDIAVEMDGVLSGPPVLLLHGAGQTRYSWKRLALDLAERGYRVVSADLRGHGDSQWDPQQRYGMQYFVDDVKALVRHFDRPPAIVGASLGGLSGLLAVGQAQAAGAPPLAAALTLVDVVARIKPEGASRIHAFLRAHPDGFETLEQAAQAVARYLPDRPKPATPDGLRKNLRRTPAGRWRWHWDPAFVGDSANERAAGFVERVEAAAAQVRIPTLIVRGGRSELVDEDGVAALQALIPQAQVAVVAQAGHMVAGDRNDDFNRAVERFLNSVMRRGPSGEKA